MNVFQVLLTPFFIIQHLTSVESWRTEICEKEEEEWEPADNTLDAQQKLDSIQSQYDQLIDAYKDLMTRYSIDTRR